MISKVWKRTFYKISIILGIIFGALFYAAAGVYFGVYFFGNPFLGLFLFVIMINLAAFIRIMYLDSKIEIEEENLKIIREFKKDYRDAKN